MHIRLARNLAKATLLSIAFASTQACTSLSPNDTAVAEAYKASDSIAVSHYSRTIFSSNNF